MKTKEKMIRCALFSFMIFVATIGILFLVSCTGTSTEKYKVTWKNYDGTILKTDEVEQGVLPSYKGDVPTKPSTDTHKYEFIGWDPKIEKVEGNQTYTAKFEEIEAINYTINWKNYDGTVLKTDKLEENTMPVYSGSTPTKPSTETHTYEFTGWDPEISKVTKNQDYTAKFKEETIKYTVTWKNYDGTILKVEEVNAGTMAVYTGDEPTRQATQTSSFEFIGWDPELSVVLSDRVYTAKFEEGAVKYSITWKNYDGTVLKVDKVERGVLPNYTGSEPERPAVPTNGFRFIGWSPELEPAHNDKEYIVKYGAVYPEKYVLATDSDFTGDRDGEFIYIGTADYVLIPEYIKGVRVTRAGNIYSNTLNRILRERPDLKGIAFQVPENITDMSGLFYNHESSQVELTYLNTAYVIDLSYMFYGSKILSLDLTNFDTGSATKMYRMFQNSEATAINFGSIDTSKVGDMSEMFAGSHALTLDLSVFDTSTAFRMPSMFAGSKATSINVSSFDTSNVTIMSHMFADSNVVILDLSNFDTSKVTNMTSMFARTKLTTINLSSFNTINVRDMHGMFQDTVATTINISSFNTKNLAVMSFMFAGSVIDTIDLSHFNTSNVYNMWAVFEGAQATTIDLSSFDTKNVNDMSEMFKNTKVTFLDLSTFDTTEVVYINGMFTNSKLITGLARNQAEADKFNNVGGFNVFTAK